MNSLAKEIQQAMPEIERNFWWHKSRRKIIEKLFFKKLKPSATPLSILSVGCSTGAEIEFLEKFGNVTAIDVDNEAIAQCRAKGLNVVKADLNDNNLTPESFDIIIACDVIEHIKDDQKAISQLHTLLKPKGKILITVPALMCLWSSFDEYGDFPHHRRYNKKNLTQLISSKFEIQKLSYYNFFLFPAIYLSRKLNKSPLTELKMPHPFINTLLYSIFSSERFFLPWTSLPIGSSLITIAHKQ